MTNEERQHVIEWLKRQRAIECLKRCPITMAGAERMYDLAIKALEQAPMIKGSTLVVPISNEDFEKVKRVMLDHEPLCGIFYEDAPGEAHWIKHETFDDGETYECDHCGVEWQFNDGGPEENEAFFCPKCGFKMIPKGEADGQTD